MSPPTKPKLTVQIKVLEALLDSCCECADAERWIGNVTGCKSGVGQEERAVFS